MIHRLAPFLCALISTLLLLRLSSLHNAQLVAAPTAPSSAEARSAVVTAAPHVAVVMCGYLKVEVPDEGRTARAHLVDTLGGDLFIAGTFRRGDCGSAAPAADDGSCLWRRLRGLEPIVARSLDVKASLGELNASLHRSPHYASIAARFKTAETYAGLTVWGPLLFENFLPPWEMPLSNRCCFHGVRSLSACGEPGMQRFQLKQ